VVPVVWPLLLVLLELKEYELEVKELEWLDMAAVFLCCCV